MLPGHGISKISTYCFENIIFVVTWENFNFQTFNPDLKPGKMWNISYLDPGFLISVLLKLEQPQALPFSFSSVRQQTVNFSRSLGADLFVCYWVLGGCVITWGEGGWLVCFFKERILILHLNSACNSSAGCSWRLSWRGRMQRNQKLHRHAASPALLLTRQCRE